MTSLAAGLGATGLVWGPGDAERRIPIADLVTGPVANALEPGEVLRAGRVPAPADLERTPSRVPHHDGRSGCSWSRASTRGPRVVSRLRAVPRLRADRGRGSG